MDESEFLIRLPAWAEGSLDDATAERMAAYVDANPSAARLAEEHDGFDRRVRDALLAGVDGGAVVERFLAEARSGADRTARKAPPRMLFAVRTVVAVAAALLIAFSLGWFYCIGPFECPYLEALEQARRAEPIAAVVPGVAGRPAPTSATETEPPTVVPVAYRAPRRALRSRYDVDGRDVTVLWCETADIRPSFRRRVALLGKDWWIAEENGDRMVAFVDPATNLLCCVIGDLPADRLLAVADELRCACR